MNIIMRVLNIIIKYVCMFVLCNNVIGNYIFCNYCFFYLSVTMYVVIL